MRTKIDRGWRSRGVALAACRVGCSRWLATGVGAAFAMSAAAQAVPPPPAAISDAAVLPSPASGGDATARGRGTLSIGYQDTFVDGMFLPVPGGEAPIGAVRVHSASLGIDYFLADHWSGHVDIPYVDSRYRGNSPHCITTAPPQCRGAIVPAQPHPHSAFLDDGHYHGTWQDWHIGLAYHGDFADYLWSPSITATIPSHRYTFFAQAAPGQDLWKIDVALDLAHQFELSSLYYRIRAGHVFAEKTLGQSIDHNTLDLELGAFLDEAFTVKTFAVGKKGHGYTGPLSDQTSEAWYHHDQRAEHNYATVGAGLDWHLNGRDTVSTTVQRLVWGQYVFDFKYSLDLRLSRDF